MLLLSRFQNLERAEQTLIDAHHGTGIVEFSTIVGCTEKGHKLALGEELVTVFYDLMGTTDQVHVVFLEEARYDIGAESEGDTTVVFAPAGNVFVGIRPQEIAEETAVGNLVQCQ